MVYVAKQMQEQGFNLPLLIGGATTSKAHTAVKIEPNYQNDAVVYVADASRAPDIHCPYCGARNVADAENCRNCGGALSGGAQRQAGRVIGAHSDTPSAPPVCPACGTQNAIGTRRCTRCGAGLVPGAALEEKVTPPSAPGCSRTMIIIGVGIAILILILIYLATRTTATMGVVQDVT